MGPDIPTSLQRIAIQRMQDVERGITTRDEAERAIRRICKISKEDLTAHLTEQYNQQAVAAFQFFRML